MRVLQKHLLKVVSVVLFDVACKHDIQVGSLLLNIIVCAYTACAYIANYVGILHFCFNGEVNSLAS